MPDSSICVGTKEFLICRSEITIMGNINDIIINNPDDFHAIFRNNYSAGT
jgi:hypothetical protein